MLFSDISNDYLAYAQHERGLSSRTVDTYSAWISHFGRWAESDGIEDTLEARFNTTVLRKYLYHLSKSGKRPRTIRNAFAPLRAIGVYLVEQTVISQSPVASLKMPKKDAPSRPIVSGQEVVALLDACDRLHDPRKRARARAIMYVMALCGLRFQEILDIKVEDVRLDMQTLLVAHGKGEKSRTLHPATPVLEALAEWLRERKLVKAQHDWLWAITTSRRVGEVGFRDLLEELKTIAGLSGHKHIQPHAFRRFFATTLNQTSGLMAAKSALGHSDVQTTFAYLQTQGDPGKAMKGLDAALPMTTTEHKPRQRHASPPSKLAVTDRAADIRNRRTTR